MFFKNRPKTAVELVRQTRDMLQAMGTKTPGDEKLMEELDKHLQSMRQILLGDGEAEPVQETVAMVAIEAFKCDLLALFVSRLHVLSWEGKKDVAQIWSSLLRQKVGASMKGVEYLEKNCEIIDRLVQGYASKETATTCGCMLRECCRQESLTQYILQSPCLDFMFKFVDSLSFDVASDAFNTLKEVLRRHKKVVADFLSEQYERFFQLYETLLTSDNYVTRRQSLKLLGEVILDRANVAVMMRFISEAHNLRLVMTLLKVFVANPNKPVGIVNVLTRNKAKILTFLQNFHMDKDDEQFEEEKSLLEQEIQQLK
eukprot:TRINITY_DN3350_c0_g1_i4.p1 TRINITY_DN3350_c0_g1~~TRINITY_DN3350_c0_g1_i4.p1  ORF type:complete len:314 (-),score=96.87 TRINITY_DN3350_c0_g1_i4:82-1023(-)